MKINPFLLEFNLRHKKEFHAQEEVHVSQEAIKDPHVLNSILSSYDLKKTIFEIFVF